MRNTKCSRFSRSIQSHRVRKNENTRRLHSADSSFGDAHVQVQAGIRCCPNFFRSTNVADVWRIYVLYGTRSIFDSSKLQPTRWNVFWFIYFFRRSTCFRRFLRPIIPPTVAASSSTGWQDLKLYVQLCAPDDGRINRLKRVQRM